MDMMVVGPAFLEKKLRITNGNGCGSLMITSSHQRKRRRKVALNSNWPGENGKRKCWIIFVQIIDRPFFFFSRFCVWQAIATLMRMQCRCHGVSGENRPVIVQFSKVLKIK